MLSIFIKIAELNAVPISTTVYWIFISILIASLVTIVLVLGAQPKGNAIFELNLSHPLLPAVVLFTCIYLCTAIDVAAWIRLAIWTIIGNLQLFIFFCNFCKIIFNDFNHFTNFIGNFERFSYGTIQFKNINSMATDFYCRNFTMTHTQLIFNCILFSLISIHYFQWNLSTFYLLLYLYHLCWGNKVVLFLNCSQV